MNDDPTISVKELKHGDIIKGAQGRNATVVALMDSCTWNKVHVKTTAGAWCYDHNARVLV